MSIVDDLKVGCLGGCLFGTTQLTPFQVLCHHLARISWFHRLEELHSRSCCSGFYPWRLQLSGFRPLIDWINFLLSVYWFHL